jgi:hypothetical protein
MNRVGPIPHEGAVTPAQGQHVTQSSQPRPSDAHAVDRVELSDAALRAPDVVRIAEIRARIADDTYLTPEKLEAAIEGLLRDTLPE